MLFNDKAIPRAGSAMEIDEGENLFLVPSEVIDCAYRSVRWEGTCVSAASRTHPILMKVDFFVTEN